MIHKQRIWVRSPYQKIYLLSGTEPQIINLSARSPIAAPTQLFVDISMWNEIIRECGPDGRADSFCGPAGRPAVHWPVSLKARCPED